MLLFLVGGHHMRPRITRIMVPVDFSAHSDQALAYAETLADRLGTSLHLVHAVEVPVMWGTETYAISLDALVIGLTEDATTRMEACRSAIPPSLTVTTDVRVGNPAATISQCAAESSADLIVMGTHGRGGLSHIFMGSVAERVMRTAPCPVLTVRNKRGSASTTDAAPA
jgi:universal stress protein A